MIKQASLTILTAAALSAGSAQADINWNASYEDVINNTNVGFDDPTLGAARQATVGAVFSYLNTVLDETGSADIRFNNSQTDGTGFLASAGPFYFTGPNGFSNGFVFDHATTGVDPTGSVPDASVTFDFGYNWNSETDASTVSEFDMFSVLLHEITHAMGFASLASSTGLSEISGGDPGVFSVYDSLLERGDGTQLFGAGGDFLGTAADFISDDVFFDGANANAANGGNPVKLHAPGTYAPGSSISHLDNSVAGVMNFSTGPGVEQRSYNAIELGILQDIGWTIVPEPSSLALLAFGGLMIGRRRRAA